MRAQMKEIIMSLDTYKGLYPCGWDLYKYAMQYEEN